MKCEDITVSPTSGAPTCKLCRDNRVECTFETPVRKRGPAPGFRRRAGSTSNDSPDESKAGSTPAPTSGGHHQLRSDQPESSRMAANRATPPVSQHHNPRPKANPETGPVMRVRLLGLPPILIDELLAIYFTHVHNVWPLIYKPMFNPHTASAPLLLAMLAISACVATPPLGPKDGVDANKLFKMAETALPANESRLDLIQALLLLSLRQTGCGDKRSAFAYAGRASCMCLNLGLNLAPNKNTDKSEVELRSRVYWSTYLLDKVSAEETGRTYLLPYRRSSMPLPAVSEVDEFEAWPPQPLSSAPLPRSVRHVLPRRGHIMSYFVWTCRLAMVVEDILDLDIAGPPVSNAWDEQFATKMGAGPPTDLFTRAEQIAEQLDQWRRHMPAILEVDLAPNVSPLPHHVVGLAWFNTTQILLYSRFIQRRNAGTPPQGPRPPESLVARAHAICSQAAEATVDLLAHLDQHKLLGQVSADIIHLLSLITLFEAYDATDPDEALAHRAKVNFAQCCIWLRDISSSWSAASAHKVFFEGLIQGGLKLLSHDSSAGKHASTPQEDEPVADSPSIPDGLRAIGGRLASSSDAAMPLAPPAPFGMGAPMPGPSGPSALFQLPQFYWNQLSTSQLPLAGDANTGFSTSGSDVTGGWDFGTGRAGEGTPSGGGGTADLEFAPHSVEWGSLPPDNGFIGPATEQQWGAGVDQSGVMGAGMVNPTYMGVGPTTQPPNQADIYQQLMTYMVEAAKGN
ncbi:hypothetical protein Q8F55_002958 [Vanrija albida]|uniref:Xylanolytic transcriptional activator regulatory domain-containing protein n=1 Tax=Vanrija albida TaxID=181172 RepID=A0ABR3QBE6_9TREE